MQTLFILLLVASLVAVVVSLIITLVSFLRKKNHRKYLKIAGLSAVVVVVSFIGAFAFSTPSNNADSTKQVTSGTSSQNSETKASDAQKQVSTAPKDKVIDAAVDETIKELEDKKNHPMVKSAGIKVDHEKKVVTMVLGVNAATNKKEALDLADTMIRRFSSNVNLHDGSFTLPSNDTYGSLFDDYNISITVAPEQFMNDKSKWLYTQYIPKGLHTKKGPNTKNVQ